MFCSQCGKKVQDNAKFCANCGHKIINEDNNKNDEKDYQKMTVNELKNILKERGLPTSGTKLRLVERLEGKSKISSVIKNIKEDTGKFVKEQKENLDKKRKNVKRKLKTKAPNEKDLRIAKNLKKYTGFLNGKQGEALPEVRCFECGYLGKAGVVRSWTPWWGHWIFLLLMLLTGIGIIWIVLIIILAPIKADCECPNCSAIIRIETANAHILIRD